MFQHTAARRRLSDRRRKYRLILVSTHSRPKAAEYTHIGRQHKPPFQHTAARRRLYDDVANLVEAVVSTHSRPKAAGSCL